MFVCLLHGLKHNTFRSVKTSWSFVELTTADSNVVCSPMELIVENSLTKGVELQNVGKGSLAFFLTCGFSI